MKLLTRILITLPAIILQIAWMIFLVWLADGVKELVDMIVAIASFNYVLYIVTKKDEGSYKILWLILILAFLPDKTDMGQDINTQWNTNQFREHRQHFLIKEASA